MATCRQVGARGNADAADLGGQRVGDVVAVQVQRGDHAYSAGRSRICCRKASAMLSLMMMSLPVFGFLNLHHGPPSISSAPNSFCASA
jgi:hypothetical protein